MAVGDERRWLRQETHKTILIMTHLSLIFDFGAIQQLVCASPLLPPCGKARPLVVCMQRCCDLVTSIFDVKIGRNINDAKLAISLQCANRFPIVSNTQPTAQRR